MSSRTLDHRSHATTSDRGPLAFVILASTGQDVRLCTNCSACEHLSAPGMDLGIGEIMRAAAGNRISVLSCRTIWSCDELLETPPVCQAGLDLPAIILALRREADLRGFSPREG